ncbi:MAG TPA: hypothetical protein VIX40_01505 [Methylomirabilota bacterium]
MSLDGILILLLALVTGVVLFVGLAQALDGRPPRRTGRRGARLPAGWRSFSAEERVLEHRARGVRTGGSPFASPPPAPVTETPRPTPRFGARASAPPPIEERPAAEQISLLDEAPVPESPVFEAPAPELAAPVPVAVEAAAPGAMEPDHDPVPIEAAEETPTATADAGIDEPEVAPAPVDLTRAPAPALASLTPALITECARLLEEGRPGELRALAEPLLRRRGRGRSRPPASYDRALLWTLVGLTHRDEGGSAELRAAFEQGVRALPRKDARGPEPEVVILAGSLGSRLLAAGEAAADASPGTLAGLRLSVGLLRGVAVCEPGQATDANGDEAAGGDELPPWGKALRAHLAVERARDALASTCERKVIALLERGDRTAAHQWIEEVAGWDELGGRLEALEEPYWKAVTDEVTRLTSQALESPDGFEAAVGLLENAEAVVRGLPSSASHQIAEMRGRLWWSYTKLGVQCMERGDEEAALEPLYRALRLAEGDVDRESETRHALAQGLEALAARASDAIAARLHAGDHAAAEAAGQALCRAVDRGLAEGVSQEELAGALGKRQHVMGLIAQADAR